MAATLRQLAELIQKRHSGGQVTQDEMVTIRQIELHIISAFGFLLKQMGEGLRGGQNLDPSYLATYENVPVEFDPDVDVYFSELPCRPADLPGGLGLFSIRPMQGKSATNKVEFMRIPPGSWSLLPSSLEGNVGYEQVSGKRVEYLTMTSRNAINKVLMQIVPGELPENDEEPLNISASMEQAVIETVLKIIGMKNFDQSNDNR